jgi:acyl-CoA thioester hydrolase
MTDSSQTASSAGRFSQDGYFDILARVRYAETDQMGMVYYANYYIYFEIGRAEYIRALGFPYRDMERDDDSFLVVAESHCRYRRSARYDDLLRIRTLVAESRRRSIRFSYEIVNDATGEVLATGETLHVVCSKEGRPKALPEKYRKFFPLNDSSGDSSGAQSGQ